MIGDIYRELRDELVEYVRDQFRMDEDAEDIVQDAFLHLLMLDRYDSLRNVASYLYQAVRNQAIDHQRKHTEERMPTFTIDNDDEAWLRDFSELMQADVQDIPDQRLEREELCKTLLIAINELPEEQRFVFEQTERYGRSYQELAEETGVPQNPLLSRKHYAVKLQSYL